MRLRNVKNAVDIVNNSKYVITNYSEYKGNFNSLFNNTNKTLRVEIGMGKGDFIIGMAEKYPDVNFIGIEKYESVMVRAIQKLEDKKLNNLKLIRMDAIGVDEVFDHEVDTLYLNFSDPWPKKRHEKRRLTSDVFLSKYDSIFVGEPHITQKTDNVGLFAYSLSSLSRYGYTLENVSLDLANEDMPNVVTEYEQKFMNLGTKINYLDAVKKQKK